MHENCVIKCANELNIKVRFNFNLRDLLIEKGFDFLSTINFVDFEIQNSTTFIT